MSLMEWNSGQFELFQKKHFFMKRGVEKVARRVQDMKDYLEEVAADPLKKTCLCQVVIASTTINPDDADAEEQAWERITEDFEHYDALLTKLYTEFPDLEPEVP